VNNAVGRHPHVLPTTDADDFVGIRPLLGKRKPWPLFFYGVEPDIMREFTIHHKIFVRVFRNLVECVIMEGVSSEEIGLLAFLTSHVDCNMYSTMPTQDDPKRLVHIGMSSSKTKDLARVAQTIQGGIRVYPAHIVLETKFHTKNSVFNSAAINRHSLRRMLLKIKRSLQ
jgi:hypothetical protein